MDRDVEKDFASVPINSVNANALGIYDNDVTRIRWE